MRFLGALIIGLSLAGPGSAQEVQRIAAIVNDDIISVYDLASRIDLAIVATGVEPSQEARRQLAPQVLRSLIDDTLRIQEARRLGVAATRSEIDRALDTIAQQNNVPPAQLDDFLRGRNVRRSALESQVEAEIAWAKILNQRLRPTIDVSDEEIDETLASRRESGDRGEYRVSEILLRVDGPGEEASVRADAERILAELRRGADFGGMARQFSDGSTAAEDGILGWVRPGQLAPVLEAALESMTVGSLSEPIRTIDGFHILTLHERRNQAAGEAGRGATVELTQILLGVPPGADEAAWEAQRDLATGIIASVEGCGAFNDVIATLDSPMSGPVGTVSVADLPGEFRSTVASLEVGRPSEPIRTEAGIHVLMVCGRDEGRATSGDAAREEVYRQLQDERLEILARRLLRDLRQAAFIDVRV